MPDPLHLPYLQWIVEVRLHAGGNCLLPEHVCRRSERRRSGIERTLPNNLILAQGAMEPVFTVGTFTNYSTSDYNGFRQNPGAAVSYQSNSPPFEVAADYVKTPVGRRYKTLAEYSQATGHDKHSVLVDYDVFVNVTKPDINDPQRLYDPVRFDFRLTPGSAAVDVGVALPNINDGYTGGAPDLGAYEVDRPVPHYGPRQANP